MTLITGGHESRMKIVAAESMAHTAKGLAGIRSRLASTAASAAVLRTGLSAAAASEVLAAIPRFFVKDQLRWSSE